MAPRPGGGRTPRKGGGSRRLAREQVPEGRRLGGSRRARTDGDGLADASSDPRPPRGSRAEPSLGQPGRDDAEGGGRRPRAQGRGERRPEPESSRSNAEKSGHGRGQRNAPADVRTGATARRGGLARLLRAKPRTGRPREAEPTEEIELLYGRNAVLETIRADTRVLRLLVADSAHGTAIDTLLSEARYHRVEISTVLRDKLDALADPDHHQGVVAEVLPFPYAEVPDLLAAAEHAGAAPLLLALDSLQDPQNFGTLLRTAQAVGVHGVLIPEHRAVGVTPAVSKASAGAVEHLTVARATNLARAIDQLKAQGVWVYGLAVEGRDPFWSVDWTTPACLVVGAEGPGLGRLVRERCDALISIPMAPKAIQSLNAATAGSLVLYEALRQRTGKQ